MTIPPLPNLPITPVQPDPQSQAELPTEIQTLINQSVQRFEEHWGMMLALAKANGYIESYRKEITELARTILNR